MSGVRPGSVVVGFDHVVLNVSDAEVTAAWFRDRLGLATTRYDEWKQGTAPFLSVRIDATTIIDLFVAPRTGENVDHLALVVGDDVDLGALAASGEFEVVRGPNRIWGARGWGQGLYVRDPDGNVIELKSYAG